MSEDEQQIRNLIEGWAEAVHGGDMLGFSGTTPTTS